MNETKTEPVTNTSIDMSPAPTAPQAMSESPAAPCSNAPIDAPPPTTEGSPLAPDGLTGLTPPAVNTSPELSTVLGVADSLSEHESAEFQACEAVIAGGWQAFVEVGLALARIRDARLYRVDYDNFQAYCRARWEYGRNYVDRLISAAQVFTHLMTISHQIPDHETQIRPLVGLTPEQAQLAWTCAVESAGGRKITARLVKRAMHDLGLAAPPKPVSKINRKAKAERRKLINDTIGQLLLLISQKAAYETILQQVEALQRHIQPLL